jgi:glucose/arabinose dehydrogenase
VVRVHVEGGSPLSVENFLTGFEFDPARCRNNGVSYTFARAAGVTVARDGALLVSDDANGIIYRVWYQGRHEH